MGNVPPIPRPMAEIGRTVGMALLVVESVAHSNLDELSETVAFDFRESRQVYASFREAGFHHRVNLGFLRFRFFFAFGLHVLEVLLGVDFGVVVERVGAVHEFFGHSSIGLSEVRNHINLFISVVKQKRGLFLRILHFLHELPRLFVAVAEHRRHVVDRIERVNPFTLSSPDFRTVHASVRSTRLFHFHERERAALEYDYQIRETFGRTLGRVLPFLVPGRRVRLGRYFEEKVSVRSEPVGE